MMANVKGNSGSQDAGSSHNLVDTEEVLTTKYAKMGTDIIFKEESYRIIGACFEVYHSDPACGGASS